MATLNTQCNACGKKIVFLIDNTDIDRTLYCPECKVNIKLTYIGHGVFEIGKVQSVAPVASTNYDYE